MGLAEQDELVTRLLAIFPGAKIVDRREKPSHGYRAVHVIPTVDDCPVEIQVRTKMQDLWAQAMEKLADEAGRQIRYGGIPDACADRVEELQQVSRAVAELEALFAELRWNVPPPRSASSGQREALLLRLRLDRLRVRAGKISQRIRDRLDTLLAGRG